jgi:hypothetical protein
LGGNLRANYFPRQVNDPSFFNIKEVDSYLDFLAKKKNVDLTDMEKEDAITNLLNDAISKADESGEYARAASNLKKRTNKVTNQNVDAYEDLHQSFDNYIESIVRQVERRKFFEGRGVDTSKLGPNGENLQSVAVGLKNSLKQGDLSPEQLDEIATLIRMRFGPGEQASSKAIQNFKNFTYGGLLGNPIAAATQFGDVALSAHKNGIMNTAVSLARSLESLNKPISGGLDKSTLLGLRDAAADFNSRVGSRDILDWALTFGGFKAMDRLGKNTFINAAMRKNQQMSRENFIAKWRPTFDPDAVAGQAAPRTEQLYDQVRNFRQIDDTNKDTIGFMLWNELADVQPIGLSALPEQYLANPNGRVAYMLQTFTLRLFDVMRRDVQQEWSAGNRKQAIANFMRLASLFTMMNGTADGAKNFVLGKDDGVVEIVQSNLLKMFGLNKFMVGQIQREGIGEAIGGTILPPLAIFDALTDPKDAVGLLPPFGRIIQSRIEE